MKNLEEISKSWEMISTSGKYDEKSSEEIVKIVENKKRTTFLKSMIKEKVWNLIVIGVLCIVVLPLYQKYRGFNIMTYILLEIASLVAFIGVVVKTVILYNIDFTKSVSSVKNNIQCYRLTTKVIGGLLAILITSIIISLLHNDFNLYLESGIILVIGIILIIGLVIIAFKSHRTEMCEIENFNIEKEQ